MHPLSNRVSKRSLPVQTGSLSATQVPLHGAYRTTKSTRRSNPIMSTRRIGQRPLPLPKLQPVLRKIPSSSSIDDSPSTGSIPSPVFSPVASVESIDTALKSVEDRLRYELNGLRVSCSQVLMSEQLRMEKLRAQSLAYQRERDFAWAKVKALMAEKMGIQPYRPPIQRRSRSCGALCNTRSLAAARPSRSQSPRVSDSKPAPYLHPSASSSTSSLEVQIKQEERPVSLASSRSASPTSPQASPSDTLVADDTWALTYPDSSSTDSAADRTPLPPLKRCHSDSSMAKASLFQWIELPDGTRVPLSGMNKAQSYVLTQEHLDVIFKEHNNQLICRMCILERKKLDRAKQLRFPVAHFDVDVSNLDRYTHCLHRHPKESEEMAKLPRSMLIEMRKGLARTDRDDDFELDYTLID
ncbi:hypothetical protein H2248_005642 [Termitomyces sp. 'cryptogamus']|nr:hypothetical protein H2248_005642 [Termitomyces sp. 'cryptogamus']